MVNMREVPEVGGKNKKRPMFPQDDAALITTARDLSRRGWVDADVASDVVPNPAEYAERSVRPTVSAVRSLRDDPVGHLHARGHLGRKDSDEANGRLARARLFQSTWEASGRGMIRSPGFDSNGGSDPTKRSGITDRKLAAAKQLSRWQISLGQTGFDLLVMILIDKCTVAEAARRRHGQANKANVTFTGHRLRECLDGL